MKSMKQIVSLYADDPTHLKPTWLKLNIIYQQSPESLLSPILRRFLVWFSVTIPDIFDQILQKIQFYVEHNK